MKSTSKILVEKYEGKRPIFYIKEIGYDCEDWPSDLGQSPVDGCFEYGNELSGSTKGE